MGTSRRRRAALGLALAVLTVVASACSSKATSPSDQTSSGGASTATVKTGKGIAGNTITIGVLTDLTGVFAPAGKDLSNAQQLFWEQQNAKGGVCGKYQVKLDVKDHGYVVANAVQLYTGMKDEVLALNLTLGAAMNVAIGPQLQTDKILNIPGAWASSLTKNPANLVVGSTYDIEMVNGISHLLSTGALKDGDQVGHIYFEGDYGANALAGSKYMAGKHNLKIAEYQIKPTDTDMTAQITDMKAKGVKAILMSTAPPQTASAAQVAASQGLDVPLFGSGPAFSGSLLKTPAGPALQKNALAGSAVTGIDADAAKDLREAWTAKYPGSSPTLSVVQGYTFARVMSQVLEKACASGDLTREGVLAAKNSLTAVDTGGLAPSLSYSQPGSPTRGTFILKPDATVPGGLKTLKTVESDDAKAYTF
jgi:ABC-type branched-subunit amino acid transport system substrate-binding protein